MIGPISTLIDVIQKVVENNKEDNNNAIDSINSSSNVMTAQYPVVVSTSVSPDAAYLVAKSLERVYATKLALCMQAYFMHDGDIAEYIRRFHTNNSNYDSPSVNRNPVRVALIANNKRHLATYEDSFNLTPLNKLGEVKEVMNEANVNALKDSDIKKANEMQPTIIANKVIIPLNNGTTAERDLLMGVKTIIHPVQHKEMVDNLVKAARRSKSIFNFFRATTGEISLAKDLIMMTDEIKDDVLKDKEYSSIWNMLRVNKRVNKISALGLTRKLIPNTTLVCSMSEIELIKSEYKVDLMNPKEALGIIKEYFLLGFVIVDESTELVHSIEDSARDFAVNRFDALSKESDKSSDIKNMINLMKVRN